MNVMEPALVHVSKQGAGLVLRLLSLSVMLTALWLALPRAALAQSTHGCSYRGAVPNPANNPGLVWDCETLLGLKDTLRGTAPLNWNATLPVSQWEGITVSAINGAVRVTGLQTTENQLEGILPPALGRLAELRKLSFSNQGFGGTIPAELGYLINLEHLHLSGNRLNGVIPSTLGNLSNLSYLNLAENNLSGVIPAGLGNILGLEYLELNDNNLSGPIPSELGNLLRLLRLSLQKNLLSGTIPVALGKLTNLESLYLNDNQLSGDVPSEVSNLPNLQAVELHSNQLTSGSPTAYRDKRPDGIPPRIAVASASPGNFLLIRRADRPEVTIELGIGWVSPTGSHTILVGVIRDQTLGQTYYIVRHSGDSRVVRRWISPTSPFVYYVDWPVVNTQYTVPVETIATIPLDDRYPAPNMLVRRFDGADDRIFAYDAAIQQWRHIPNWPTFQALGFFWCDVTAADSGFFDRITVGPPFPATTAPTQDNYPNCRT